MADTTEAKITAPSDVDMALVTGPADALLRRIQDEYSAKISVRGNEITASGGSVELRSITSLFTDMFGHIRSGEVPDEAYLDRMIALLKTTEMSPSELRNDILLTHRGKAIRPKTAGQKRFVDAIRRNTITFGLGPAGTGKTYLTCAMAVAALNAKQIGRIVLTRPIVEAGESLGFLPGTMMEKVDPYIRPLYDALFEMIDTAQAQRWIDDGTIEITPLAFMRGRTFNDSFVILYEAQNTTPDQMKMFLTRLGFGSKMVITGDESQSDNPRGPAGIASARQKLADIDDIAFCELSGADVVRNSLVARIVAAYEKE
ncbi:MAG: PhoH family protein [Eggerthellaceae bacterium]|nr:PhoH family protein [Eggerthellaceae bacterium]